MSTRRAAKTTAEHAPEPTARAAKRKRAPRAGTAASAPPTATATATATAPAPAPAPAPASAPAPAPEASYHHGDLHAALIAAAESLLQDSGLEGFSLRECARRAGVSHAAPAHHFGDARGLLSACAAAGFNRLADAMDRRAIAAGLDAAARLRAIGGAYVDFALAHRALFQLMFRRDRLDPAHPALQAAGRRTGDALRGAIDGLMAAQALPDAERGARILLAWSVVHGYATLVLEDQCADLFGLSAADPAAAGRMGDELLQLLQHGVAQPRR